MQIKLKTPKGEGICTILLFTITRFFLRFTFSILIRFGFTYIHTTLCCYIRLSIHLLHSVDALFVDYVDLMLYNMNVYVLILCIMLSSDDGGGDGIDRGTFFSKTIFRCSILYNNAYMLTSSPIFPRYFYTILCVSFRRIYFEGISHL